MGRRSEGIAAKSALMTNGKSGKTDEPQATASSVAVGNEAGRRRAFLAAFALIAGVSLSIPMAAFSRDATWPGQEGSAPIVLRQRSDPAYFVTPETVAATTHYAVRASLAHAAPVSLLTVFDPDVAQREAKKRVGMAFQAMPVAMPLTQPAAI